MGRKAKPTALHVIAGTDRPDRNSPAEVKASVGLPMKPPFLSPEAQQEWTRVSQQLLDMGVLALIDRAALAAYCQAYGRWEQAETALAKMAARDPVTRGMMIKTTSGNAIQNPLVGSANKAMADMMRYAAEFGMTPSARTRIQTGNGGTNDDPASGYF